MSGRGRRARLQLRLLRELKVAMLQRQISSAMAPRVTSCRQALIPNATSCQHAPLRSLNLCLSNCLCCSNSLRHSSNRPQAVILCQVDPLCH